MSSISKSIVMRRILSSIIDLFIALFAAFLTQRHIRVISEDKLGLLSLTWYSYLILTIIFLIISHSGTIGDFWLKISIVGVDGSQLSLYKLILRNIFCWMLLGLITIDDPDKLYYFGILVGMPVLSYIFIFSKKNKYKENMTSVDFVFKTKYILKK